MTKQNYLNLQVSYWNVKTTCKRRQNVTYYKAHKLLPTSNIDRNKALSSHSYRTQIIENYTM